MELKRRAPSAAGYSLVEALIATAVLGFIAIGILPLFTQAMVNNKQGSDSTTVTTFGKTNLEALDAIPFDGAAVTVPAGSLSCVAVDWYVQQSSATVGGTNGKWIVTYPVGGGTCAGPAPVQSPPTGQGQVLWKRTTTVQQYNVGDLTFSSPEDGSTSSDFVHLKKIQVVVQRPIPGMPATAGKTITLQLLRAD